MTHGGIDRTLEALLRELAPQVLAAVVRRYGHFDLAEDATQEACWPRPPSGHATAYPISRERG